MKSKLEIYALAVCFGAVFCLVINIGAALYDVCRIAVPSFTLSAYEYDKFESNDAFWKSVERDTPASEKDKDKVAVRPPEAELSARREAGLESAFRSERRGGARDALKNLMYILTAAAALLIHWRIARSARSWSFGNQRSQSVT